MSLENYYLRQVRDSANAGMQIMNLLGSPADSHCNLVRAKIAQVDLNDQQFLESIPAADPSFAAVLDPMSLETAPPSFGQSFSDFAIGEHPDLAEIETIADGSIRQIEIEGKIFVFCFSIYWQRDLDSQSALKKRIIGTIAAAEKIPVVKSIPKVLLQNLSTRESSEVKLELKTPFRSLPDLSGLNGLKYEFENMVIYRRRVLCWWHKKIQIPNCLFNGEGGQHLSELAKISISAPFSPQLKN